MKDKLIATITLGLIFSLFFYYKVVNPNHENLVFDTYMPEYNTFKSWAAPPHNKKENNKK